MAEDLMTRAAAMDWREAERSRVAQALDDAFELLLLRLNEALNAAPDTDLLRPGRLRRQHVDPVVADWVARVQRDLRREMEQSFKDELLAGDPADTMPDWESVVAVGATALGVAAPLAVVPLAASLAATTTTALFFFTTSSVSIPVVSAIAVGTAGVMTASGTARRAMFAKLRSRNAARIREGLERQIMGQPPVEGRLSLREQLLAEIDAAARARMEGLT